MRAALVALAVSLTAAAAEKDKEPEKSPTEEKSDAERIDSLEDKVKELEAALRRAEESLRAAQPVHVSGYADLGFFVPRGNGGAGVVEDFENETFPQYQGQYGWVFLGDLLAPVVNSRGEAADLGDLPGVQRYDSVHSHGAPGFIANELNLTVSAGLSEQLLATTSVNFVPRSGNDFALGDAFDVDIAQLEWIPFANGKTSFFVGKFDSVIGIEYRDRKPTNRFGVTPSLIARYTTGTPLGIKARTKLFPGDLLTIAAAITNGSSGQEQFHFYDEIDTNAGKTVSGRVSLKLQVPAPGGHTLGDLEVGASGEYGAQDRALDSSGILWFLGGDLLFTSPSGGVQVKAQVLRGMGAGRAVDQVYGLHLGSGGYLEADVKVTPMVGVLGRGEWRDAFVWLGSERAYVTKSWRGTLGARVTFNSHVTLKAEYLLNGEYYAGPQIPNDVFTSSLLLSY